MKNSRIFHSPNLQKLFYIQKNVYHGNKLTTCKQHLLPQSYFCIQQKCPRKNQLSCKQCITSISNQNNHLSHLKKIINVNKIIPQLTQFLSNQWKEVQKQDQQILSQWRNTEINLKYCIDILNQLLKQVNQRYQQGKQLLYLPILQDITTWVHEMFQVVNPCSLVKDFDRINMKYSGLFSEDKQQEFSSKNSFKQFEKFVISSQIVQNQRQKRLKKNKKISQKSKKFSQQALIFSQELAKTINDKIQRQKRVNKIKKLQAHKIMCLSNFEKKTREELYNMGQLLIQLSNNNTNNNKIKKLNEEEQGASSYQQLMKLRECQNLKSLHINNQNGGIQQKVWDKITNQLEFLKNLKELKLNLRAIDLKFLIKLFKKRPNAIRHIDSLFLKISDEPNLDLKDVSQFCNCFQLKSLFLTLTRDNISSKQKVLQFYKDLRIHTSLTHLPMNQFNLNLSKNKIGQNNKGKDDDKITLENQFNKVFGPIKKKTLLL